jgi:hypothetical protein
MAGILIAELFGVNRIDPELRRLQNGNRMGVQAPDPGLITGNSWAELDPIRFEGGDPPNVDTGRKVLDPTWKLDDPAIS